MTTTEEDTINVSGSGQNEIEPNPKINLWADRVDEFSSTRKEKKCTFIP